MYIVSEKKVNEKHKDDIRDEKKIQASKKNDPQIVMNTLMISWENPIERFYACEALIEPAANTQLNALQIIKTIKTSLWTKTSKRSTWRVVELLELSQLQAINQVHN